MQCNRAVDTFHFKVTPLWEHEPVLLSNAALLAACHISTLTVANRKCRDLRMQEYSLGQGLCCDLELPHVSKNRRAVVTGVLSELRAWSRPFLAWPNKAVRLDFKLASLIVSIKQVLRVCCLRRPKPLVSGLYQKQQLLLSSTTAIQ